MRSGPCDFIFGTVHSSAVQDCLRNKRPYHGRSPPLYSANDPVSCMNSPAADERAGPTDVAPMSVDGTELPVRNARASAAIGGKADPLTKPHSTTRFKSARASLARSLDKSVSRLARLPVRIRPKGRSEPPLHRVRCAQHGALPSAPLCVEPQARRLWRSRHKLFVRRHDDQQRVGPVRDDDGSPRSHRQS